MQTSQILAALVAGAVVVPAAAAGDRSLTESFDFRPGDRLVIDTALGHVEVTTAANDRVTVEVTTDKGALAEQIRVEFDDRDGLRIVGRKVGGGLRSWFRDTPEIEFRIAAPRQLELDVKTGGGHVRIDDVTGDVSLRTSGGHIRFGDVDGQLDANTSGGHISGGDVRHGGELKTSGGHIRLDDVGSSVVVRTSGGHIKLGDVAGDVTAATSGGHITLGEVDGSVEAETGGGHVEVAGARDADVSTSGGHIRLQRMHGFAKARSSGGRVALEVAAGNTAGADIVTSGGDIRIALPKGHGFDIDADSGDGDVVSDVEVVGERTAGRLRGRIAGGGGSIRARAADGDIRIAVR